MNRFLWGQIVASVLALNYFAFQVELFENEYEANHPKMFANGAFSLPTLTWESFDKENAPPPFVFDACIQLTCSLVLPDEALVVAPENVPHNPVRDKSPPASAAIS